MKQFYSATLMAAALVAFSALLVTIAMPTDAFLASTLACEPDEWSIQLSDRLRDHLSLLDLHVKPELVTALRIRASLESNMFHATVFPVCLAVIAFSIVGLIREKRIERFRQTVEG